MDPTTRFDPTDADGDRSLGDLLKNLTTDATRLVRQEAALAKSELRANVRAVARDAGGVAVGAIIAAVGALVLVAALVAFLGDVMGDRYALAALIVGGVFVAIGGFLVMRALKELKKGKGVAPAEALATVRDTTGWAKGEVADLKATMAAGHVVNEHADPRGDGRRHDGGPVRVRDEWRGPDHAKESTTSGKPRKGERTDLPLSVPLWKRVMHEFKEDDLSNQAAKVAYYFFLSLPPALMAIFGLTGLLGGQKAGDWLSGRLSSSLPPEAGGLIDGFVNDVVHKNAPGPLSIGLLLALWAASNVFTALEDTLNDAYDVTCERSFIQRKLVSLAVLLVCSILFVAGSTTLLAGPAIAKALLLGPAGDLVWSILQWPMAFGLIVGTFFVIYYVLPNKDQKGCKKTLLKSSAISAAIWILATLAFRIYITNFGSYSKTYGLLGTVIVLLLWMWMTSLVILLGGEISSEMERES